MNSLDRYSRQVIFPGIGKEGQEKLAQSTVVVIGCGSLGTVAASTLARAGVGALRVIDRDFRERERRRARHQGSSVTRVPPSPETGCVSPFYVEAAIGPATRLIAVTHVSNVSGAVQPIDEIGEVARKHCVAFLEDAAQSAGVLPIDVRAANVDLLALSGHKGPLGPPGTGVLYVSKRAAGADARYDDGATDSSRLHRCRARVLCLPLADCRPQARRRRLYDAPAGPVITRGGRP